MASKSRDGPPLMYMWHEKKYLGAAHGISGILYTLLMVRVLSLVFIHGCFLQLQLLQISILYFYYFIAQSPE
jgi:hypothetical protein